MMKLICMVYGLTLNAFEIVNVSHFVNKKNEVLL